MTRSLQDVLLVRDLVAAGLSTKAISRTTGIARATIREWTLTRRWDCPERLNGSGARACAGDCGVPSRIPTATYAYLLGIYLGDGYISAARRGVYRLRIACATAYPEIIRDVETAIHLVSGNKVGRVPYPYACVEIHADWKHWPCLFPQHGSGRKHTRPIVLAAWQESIAGDHPEMLLRGLLHSDGCRVINRVTVRGRRYEYPRYFFSNHSADILRIFCTACDRLGIEWRMDGPFDVSVARRGSVALLDTFVGRKA